MIRSQWIAAHTVKCEHSDWCSSNSRTLQLAVLQACIGRSRQSSNSLLAGSSRSIIHHPATYEPT